MTTILAAFVVVGLGVLGLCFNIIFRKKDFPHYDVGSNEEMKKIGIRCFKDEDAELHGRHCNGSETDACKECNLYKK